MGRTDAGWPPAHLNSTCWTEAFRKSLRLGKSTLRAGGEVFASLACLLTPSSQAVAARLGADSVELPPGPTPLLYVSFPAGRMANPSYEEVSATLG